MSSNPERVALRASSVLAVMATKVPEKKVKGEWAEGENQYIEDDAVILTGLRVLNRLPRVWSKDRQVLSITSKRCFRTNRSVLGTNNLTSWKCKTKMQPTYCMISAFRLYVLYYNASYQVVKRIIYDESFINLLLQSNLLERSLCILDWRQRGPKKMIHTQTWLEGLLLP
jgi:hypothetical protein